MNPVESSKPQWGASYRLIAVEKWKMKSAAMGRAATDALVEYARPQQGMHVLDLASGTGEPGISLAGDVGPEGQVVAVDLSAELLEVARERGQQRGLSNFSTQQADAHRRDVFRRYRQSIEGSSPRTPAWSASLLSRVGPI